MAHHSSNMDPRFFEKLFTAKPELGPTGQFPEGKLTDSDEGEIRIGITHMNGKVVIDFGKPTAWIGFTAEQADGIAELLKKHADKIRAVTTT